MSRRSYQVATPSGVPSYAQPTISFSNHSSVRLRDSGSIILKAGASKELYQSSVFRAKSKAPEDESSAKSSPRTLTSLRINSKKRYTDHSNDSPILKKGSEEKVFGKHLEFDLDTHRISSYRSPTLVTQDFDLPEPKESLNSIIKEADVLIQKVYDEPDNSFFTEKLDLMRALIENEDLIPVKECEKWIEEFSSIVSKFQEKILLDNRLITRVLELNNIISVSCKIQENKVKEKNKEIGNLKRRLEFYESLNLKEKKDSYSSFIPSQIKSNPCGQFFPDSKDGKRSDFNGDTFLINATDIQLSTEDIAYRLSSENFTGELSR